MKPDYRSIARAARDRAVQELTDSSGARVRYAALELRTAMEALVYERVLIYESELKAVDLATWQPRRVFEVLLDLDPYADQSSSLSIAEESSPGVAAGPFQHLGDDRVISTKELKKYYDRLGSYLHAPTVQQARDGAGPSPDQMRVRCQEVLKVIDEVLSSRIFSVDFKNVATLACVECGGTIVCRMPRDPQQGRIVDCAGCIASYRVEPDAGAKVTWKPMQKELRCRGPGCDTACIVWHREVELGRFWQCKTCGGRNNFALGLAYRSPKELADAERSKGPSTKSGGSPRET